MPDRIQLRRTKGWTKPPGAVVVARPSIWGNPWVVGNPGRLRPPPHPELAPTDWNLHRPVTAGEAVGSFAFWLAHGFTANPHATPFDGMTDDGRALVNDAFSRRRWLILSCLHDLRHCDLCCWCKPGQPCHADVLLALAADPRADLSPFWRNDNG